MTLQLSIPHDVTLGGPGTVTDLVREISYPINDTAARMFTLIGASSDSDRVASRLSQEYGLDPDTAQAAIQQFVNTFNPLGLVNVKAPSTWHIARHSTLSAAITVITTGLRPGRGQRPNVVRTALPAGDTRRALAITGRAFLPASAKTTAAVILALLALLAGLRAGHPTTVIPVAFAIGAATGVGMWIHELAHLAALRGAPACAITAGITPAITYHPGVPRWTAAWATIAGPLSGGLLAIPTLAAGILLESLPLALAGLVLASQLLGLTLITHDGRHLAHTLQRRPPAASA